MTPSRELIFVLLTTTGAAIIGVVPVFVAALFNRRLSRQDRRERDGACIHCGYCLTGNTTGICPECGVRVSMKL